MWAVSVGTFLGLLLMIYSPLNTYLKLAPLTPQQFLFVSGISILAVMWYEAVKLVKHLRKSKRQEGVV